MQINWILNKHESWEISTKNPFSVSPPPTIFNIQRKYLLYIFPLGRLERKETKLKTWGEGDVFEIDSLKYPFHLPEIL